MAAMLGMKALALAVMALAYASVTSHANDFQCGVSADGKVCSDRQCCSLWGYCGYTSKYCGSGCQSQCHCSYSLDHAGGVAAYLTRDLFVRMLPPADGGAACPDRGFYTYDAFVAAAGTFRKFGAVGDYGERRRDVAAFLAQASDEIDGGGYCHKEVKSGSPAEYCAPSDRWPCAPGKTYHPRGPMRISYNYNYGPVGEAIGVDLLRNPELVATDPIVAFRAALWLWMTPPAAKQLSCHDAPTGLYWNLTSSLQDGYELAANILGGGGAGEGPVRLQYKRNCDILGVSYGHQPDCFGQPLFESSA